MASTHATSSDSRLFPRGQVMHSNDIDRWDKMLPTVNSCQITKTNDTTSIREVKAQKQHVEANTKIQRGLYKH
jgi:hypothetical protein